VPEIPPGKLFKFPLDNPDLRCYIILDNQGPLSGPREACKAEKMTGKTFKKETQSL